MMSRKSGAGSAALEELRKRVDLPCGRPEGLDADAHLLQRVEVLRDPVAVPGRKLDGHRHEQPLRGHALGFHAAAQFLEEDALVRRMLIHQHEAVCVFHEDVKPAQHAEDAEILRPDAGRCGWRGGWTGAGSAATAATGNSCPILPQRHLLVDRDQSRRSAICPPAR